MSELMLRVVSAICPRCGADEAAEGDWWRQPHAVAHIRQIGLLAGGFHHMVCIFAGAPRDETTRLLFATEPVDREPREEQAG